VSAPASNPLRRLAARFEHLIRELGKFGTVGGVAFAVDTAVYWTLLSRGMETLTAKALTTVVSASVAFLGNRFWTWRHRPRSGLRREYSLYFFFNLVGLGINWVILGISHYGLGHFWPAVFRTDLADLLVAQIFGTFAASLFRFWSYRRIVFRPVGAEPVARPDDSAQVAPPVDTATALAAATEQSPGNVT
jgi:putative flippase GtrA